MATESGGAVGAKAAVSGTRAVASSQHPLVTDAMIGVLDDGGTAADAAIAGALVHGVVQQEMTTYTGTVTFLYYDAPSGEIHELNSWGTIASDLEPFRRVPAPHGDLVRLGNEPFAVIPGFMPGMKALFERFGTKPWDYLCQPALHWAQEGHEVLSLEHRTLATEGDMFFYTPSGREHFAPNGHLPQVGQRWPKPLLASTLERLAKEGPDYFITGEWADHFVERARELGWPIERRHMDANPPRWGRGVRYEHRGYELVQLSPPETQAITCSMVLDILEELDVPAMGHWSDNADSLYFLAHALRRARFETGFVNDPYIFRSPADHLMSRDYHRVLAQILRDSKPTADLLNHVRLTAGRKRLSAAGMALESVGSCEISLVDSQGSWMQLMNTLQSGGIPGEVIDGVPNYGSHSTTDMSSWIAGWFAEGARMRGPMGNTFILKDGKPWLSLGTPGSLWATVVQVISNILDYGMDPVAAEDAPRLLALTDDYQVAVESRLPPSVVEGLARMGILVDPLEPYNWHLGSFQMSWRGDDGSLHAVAGQRRAGKAAAL